MTRAGAAEQAASIVSNAEPNAAAFRDAVAQGVSLARSGDHAHAANAFARACALMPQSASAWRALGDMRFALGDWAGSNEAHLRSLDGTPDARLTAARAAIEAGHVAQAYGLLSERLAATPTDIAALTAMAEVAFRAGRLGDAASLLQRALERAPGCGEGWVQLAAVLDQMSAQDALALVRAAAAPRPDIWGYRPLEASMVERTGDYAGTLALLEAMLAERPEEASIVILRGHVLRTLGRTDDAIAAYRRAAGLRPGSGEPWWALADIKSFRFSAADLATLETLATIGGTPAERAHAQFALGRAAELAGDHRQAFAHYDAGNRLKRSTVRHDRAAIDRDVERAAALFTPQFFAARDGWGAPAADSIFIVGMPRSGSTLVEQILASHPDIEATRELPDLPAMVHGLVQAAAVRGKAWPAMLGDLAAGEVRAHGEDYLRRALGVRHTKRARFIDKLPANFAHVGLIRLILPNARVIDVRRDTPACGYSIFRQNFAGGHSYAFDIEDIAAQYRGYLATMALWDERLPGFVHRVRYETLVADVEGETRRLLAFLGVPFHPACLAFFDTQRPIRTPSGEQVRVPVNRDGLDAWEPYSEWLKPLIAITGSVPRGPA